MLKVVSMSFSKAQIYDRLPFKDISFTYDHRLQKVLDPVGSPLICCRPANE